MGEALQKLCNIFICDKLKDVLERVLREQVRVLEGLKPKDLVDLAE